MDARYLSIHNSKTLSISIFGNRKFPSHKFFCWWWSMHHCLELYAAFRLRRCRRRPSFCLCVPRVENFYPAAFLHPSGSIFSVLPSSCLHFLKAHFVVCLVKIQFSSRGLASYVSLNFTYFLIRRNQAQQHNSLQP